MQQDGLTASTEELACAVSSCAHEVSFSAHQSIYEARPHVSTHAGSVCTLQLRM